MKPVDAAGKTTKIAESSKASVLNPTVVKLGFVSFFADVASEMLYPITPIFLTSVLGASMANLGLIEGVAESIASLMKTYSGSWSDRISRRKPFVLAGYFMAAVAKPFIGLSTHWLEVLCARGLDRTGKGLRSAPRDALLADSVSENFRGAAFGWHRGMDTLGAAVGPLFSVWYMNLNPGSYRSLYFWALVPGLLSVLLVFSVREKPRVSSEVSSAQPWKNPWQMWHSSSSEFKKYILAWGAFSLANSSDVFLLMKVKSAGASVTTVILMYCAYNLVYSLSSPVLGKISDSYDRKKLLIFGLAVFTGVYLGFSVAKAIWEFWCLFLVYGIYMGATDGVGKALAVDLSAKNLKATSLGLLGTVTGFATLFASAVAGLLWDHWGAQWAFAFGATGAIAAILLLLRIPKVSALRT